jgi:hypothetical protein
MPLSDYASFISAIFADSTAPVFRLPAMISALSLSYFSRYVCFQDRFISMIAAAFAADISSAIFRRC